MPKTVLIVEDIDDIQAMMLILVKSFGYDVITADNGRQAIEKVKMYQPDLIFMDLMMPEMDGLTATKIIRESDSNKMPIIALTAFHEGYYNQALEAGCDRVIPKPINFDDMRAVLGQYLSN